jgi:AcrR family transcriptional regulator
MTEYSSRGDPHRSMALLWGRGEPPTRGPKQALSVPEIVTAAVALADTEGLGALSMRRVAERLGKSPMALYTYVPGKAELLDLMLDSVLGELAAHHERGPGPDGWRVAVEAWAAAQWAWCERHPWVLHLGTSRAVLGPNELDAFEAALRLVDGLGLTGVEMQRVVGAVGSFVTGTAKAVADARAAEQVTGVSDDDWWNARSPLLDEMAGDVWAERYPVTTRLDAEQAFAQLDRDDADATPYTVRDALDTFEFGLARLLDGIAAFVAARRAERGAGEGTPG